VGRGLVVWSLLLGLVGLLGLSSAHADPKKPPTKADETFERGRAFMDKGDFANACAAFEQSLQLDFQFGTLYNLAGCDEKLGKIASALKAYRKIAHDDFNQARRTSATDLIAKLQPRVATVTVTLAVRPPKLHVVLDATPIDDVLGTEIEIDLGAHTIKATASGQPDQVKSIHAKEGEQAQIALHFDAPRVVGPSPLEPGPAKRGLFGKITAISGGVVLVTGLVFGGIALHDWNHAQTIAGTDPSTANHDVHTTRILGDVSTILVIVGAAATATGIYLWRTDHGATISPQVGADGGGVSVLGTF
jgi:Tetratricopeptide repeat